MVKKMKKKKKKANRKNLFAVAGIGTHEPCIVLTLSLSVEVGV